MGTYRGNVPQLEADAESIVRRYLAGEAGVAELMREYHVAWPSINRLLRRHTTAAQRRRVTKRTRARCLGGRFQKGNVPSHKGTKGVMKANSGSFKPGCLRGQAARNYRAVGAIVTRYDSVKKKWRGRRPKRGRPRLWIKISDDAPRARDNWIPLARHVWLAAGRTVPDGCFIVHFDGDTLNCKLDNLRCVDRRGHLALQIARNPEQLVKQRRNAGEANRQRHAANRRRKKLFDHDPPVIVWECAACAGDVDGRRPPERCAKCGSWTFIRRALRPKRRAI